jgi:hypothetical protein
MAATTTSSCSGALTHSTSRPSTPVKKMSPSMMHASLSREKRKVEARKRGQLRALERL